MIFQDMKWLTPAAFLLAWGVGAAAGASAGPLVWASNRANPKGRETNLFIARWVD